MQRTPRLAVAIVMAALAAPAAAGDCYADCNDDGVLDFFDFLCFQNQFAVGDPAADCDGDGILDLFDFLCFQNEFAAGCPTLELVLLGKTAPPTEICGQPMTKFPVDTRPLFTYVSNCPCPSGGQLQFSYPLSHRRIGSFGGWLTWSHGYRGDVYWNVSRARLDVTVPDNSVFYLYVENNPFAGAEFEIIGYMGGEMQSVKEVISGASNARGYAFCGGVEKVHIRATDGRTDFAIGEFGIAN